MSSHIAVKKANEVFSLTTGLTLAEGEDTVESMQSTEQDLEKNLKEVFDAVKDIIPGILKEIGIHQLKYEEGTYPQWSKHSNKSDERKEKLKDEIVQITLDFKAKQLPPSHFVILTKGVPEKDKLEQLQKRLLAL